MHRIPLLAILLLACSLHAADDSVALALWAYGDGSIDGARAKPGQTILAGQEIAAADDRPLRVLLNDAPGSTVIIGAGSMVRFLVVDLGHGKGIDLVLDVNRGVVQVDLPNRGPWRELRVHGGAMDVHVLGTLFMFERVKRDQDYLAMVHGKVRVNLVAAIAQALGQDPNLEIEGQRGIGAGAGGFGGVDQLAGRPQIAAAAAARLGLQSQGLGGNGGWGVDAALVLTGSGPGADPSGTMGLGTPAPGANPLPGATVAGGAPPEAALPPGIETVTNAVTENIHQVIVEGVIQQTVQQVIDHVTTTTVQAPLPGPPPHP